MGLSTQQPDTSLTGALPLDSVAREEHQNEEDISRLLMPIQQEHGGVHESVWAADPNDPPVMHTLPQSFSDFMPLSGGEDLSSDIPLFEIESQDILSNDLMQGVEIPDPFAKGEVIGQPVILQNGFAQGHPISSQPIPELSPTFPSGSHALSVPDPVATLGNSLDLSLGNISTNSSLDLLLAPTLPTINNQHFSGGLSTIPDLQAQPRLDISDPSFPTNLEQLQQPPTSLPPPQISQTLLSPQEAQDVLSRDISAVLQSGVDGGGMSEQEQGLHSQLLQNSSGLVDGWVGGSDALGWGPGLDSDAFAGSSTILGSSSGELGRKEVKIETKFKTRKSARSGGRGSRGEGSKNDAFKSGRPRNEWGTGKLILGRDSNDHELLIREKQKFGRVTLYSPASMSGKSAGKLASEISRMDQLCNQLRDQHMMQQQEKLGTATIIHKVAGDAFTAMHKPRGVVARMCLGDDESNPCSAGVGPSTIDHEADTRTKGFKRLHRRRTLRGQVPGRQLRVANEKLRNSFVRRVKTVRGVDNTPRSSATSRPAAHTGVAIHHAPSTSAYFPRRSASGVPPRPCGIGRASHYHRAVKSEELHSADINNGVDGRASQEVTRRVHHASSGSIGTRGSSSRRLNNRMSLPNETRHIIRPHGARKKREITFEHVKKVCRLPINEAAHHLDIGVTVLKKYCRKFEIPRWPYRILSSLDKLIKSMERTQEQDCSLLDEISQLKDLKASIEADPRLAQDIPDWVKKIRQHNFKFEYKKRQNEKKLSTSE